VTTTSIVDTDVFSSVYVNRRSNDERVERWREHLAGRRVLISFQTRAEVLAGARSSGWGERRMEELYGVLNRMPTIYADDEIADAYAELVAECRRTGHALHAKEHSGDRWIAACAVAKNLELVAGDGIYRDAPDLSLVL
jgi:predicted nucleic acid-binding protein